MAFVNDLAENIVAPATVPGTGAVGIIRLSGPDVITIADSILTLSSHTRGKRPTLKSTDSYKMRFARIQDVDEVLAVPFRAPNSYTGENCVEIYCHASSYIENKIQQLLIDSASTLFKSSTISSPLRIADAGEFTKRAFLNGKMDLAQAEAVADLIASETEASHRIAMNQMRGGFSNELRALRESLLNLCALMELELDFSEEDVEFADRKKLSSILSSTYLKIKDLADSFSLGNAIKNGIPVAIVGATNTGKSTLLNALLELKLETSELSEKIARGKNTTRQSELIEKDGLRVMDTAGFNLLEPEKPLQPEQLRERYPEFRNYEGKCRFRECLHDREPGCAVQEAADRGEIHVNRLLRYRQLLAETREVWRERYD